MLNYQSIPHTLVIGTPVSSLWFHFEDEKKAPASASSKKKLWVCEILSIEAEKQSVIHKI